MENETFVGREKILLQCREYIRRLEQLDVNGSPIFITVKGLNWESEDKGGIGKTKLLLKLDEIVTNDLSYRTTGIIDLKATPNRSSISILQTIAVALDPSVKGTTADNQQLPGSGAYKEFFDAVHAYNAARDQEKYDLYEPLIQSFISCCKKNSERNPQVIFLDTFESIQDLEFSSWLLEMMGKLGGRTAIVVAGRRPIGLSNVEVLPVTVDRLSLPEIDLLGRKLFARQVGGVTYDISQDTIEKIEFLTEGRPILVVLTFEWIIKNVVESEAIIAIPKDEFEPTIVRYLSKLEQDQDVAVVMMATIDRRLTARIMSLLTKWPLLKCLDIAKDLSRFAFVKIVESESPEEIIFRLHDEMLRLVTMYADFPVAIKNKWLREVVSQYYESEIQHASNPQNKQTLIAEQLHYQLRYSVEEAVDFFDEKMQDAIASYEFEFCDLLLSELRKPDIVLTERLRNIVDLNYAEMLVKSYQPFEAKSIFDQLIVSFDPEHDTELFGRAISGLGACVANGSTIIEANIYEAINLLKNGLDVCKEKGLRDRVAVILYQIGYCYDLLGYNDETLRYFSESNNMARAIHNAKLVTTTLDEMGKLRLKRYEVSEALSLFQESLEMKQQARDTKGMAASYHFLGNAYRDLDNFPEAFRWYDLAEKASKQIADDWELCQLYSDVAWLYLLAKDWKKTAEYVHKEYYDLALPRHFGREIADAEHTLYHLTLETEGLDAALPWIEKAFQHAERYSNTFIILDAALHLIEAAYQKGEYHKIAPLFEKMDELDRKGCGYRMFKGRAVNLLGDIDFDNQDFVPAVDKWQEGFTIVGIHGRSRSATLMFDDFLQQKHSRISDALKKCGLAKVEQFQRHWEETILDQGKPITLAQEYPAMHGILNLTKGDLFYEQDNYSEALREWLHGFMHMATHISTKARSPALIIDEHIESRRGHIEAAFRFVGPATLAEIYETHAQELPTGVTISQAQRLAEMLLLIRSAFHLKEPQ